MQSELSGPMIRRSLEARLAGATGADAGLKDRAGLCGLVGGDGVLAYLAVKR